MKILAIDTSTDYLTLAVTEDKKVLSRIHKRAPMSHSSLLVPMIAKVLKKAHFKLKEIDCFAIGIGPGSFTGLRIGVTTMKGLAFALKKPVAAIPTLDAIAQNVKKFHGIVCPVLDAKKNKVYACLYKSDGEIVKRISKYLLLTPEDLFKLLKKYDKVLFLGDAINLMEMERPFERSFSSRSQDQILLRKIWHPKAEFIARLGLEYAKRRRFTSAEDLEPLYLYSRECDIKGI